MQAAEVVSPNTSIQPSTARVNEKGHLEVGGCDTVDLAATYGTPLWVVDEKTLLDGIAAAKAGLSRYPAGSQLLYAGKAFLCLAMCHLLKQLAVGLDVVSSGELYTAEKADFPPHLIYMHGNNKSAAEIESCLRYGPVNIVVDSEAELRLVIDCAQKERKIARILLRVIPEVETDTHEHIKTGHTESKFGMPVEQLLEVAALAAKAKDRIELLGLHAHIGSQTMVMGPYIELSGIMSGLYEQIKRRLGMELPVVDLGGGLGITYTSNDPPIPIYTWAFELSCQVEKAWTARHLRLPKLLIEPGRAIIGPAGLTLYRAGHRKQLKTGVSYLALDGGMADNPRPITYQAEYTAIVASDANQPKPAQPISLVGKYCESGDIIVKDAYVNAASGDLIAVFGTGAYNYSMASNYNRTARPACILVADGQAEVIVERESHADLLRKDKIPPRLIG